MDLNSTVNLRQVKMLADRANLEINWFSLISKFGPLIFLPNGEVITRKRITLGQLKIWAEIANLQNGGG